MGPESRRTRRPAFATLDTDRRFAAAPLFRSVHAHVTEGFPSLVEMDVADPWRRGACEEVFDGVPLMFVVLWAERHTAMGRVRDRGTGGTFWGWYEKQYDRFDWTSLDAHVIDTTAATPDEVAAHLVELIETPAHA